MNVLQSMKFCVMEDNRLKKREESLLFLDSFAARFSCKNISRISCFFYLASFKISLFVVVLALCCLFQFLGRLQGIV